MISEFESPAVATRPIHMQIHPLPNNERRNRFPEFRVIGPARYHDSIAVYRRVATAAGFSPNGAFKEARASPGKSTHF